MAIKIDRPPKRKVVWPWLKENQLPLALTTFLIIFVGSIATAITFDVQSKAASRAVSVLPQVNGLWEHIPSPDWWYHRMFRLETPEGWIVKDVDEDTIIYVPDPDHLWELTEKKDN